MPDLAIIGGTGLTTLETLEITQRQIVHTPYGELSSPLIRGRLCDREVVFLARHGSGHTIPPHKVNYRANIWALREMGVRRVLAVAAVGGIREDMTPGRLAIPDQIIDYTWGRPCTFFEEDLQHVTHIEFAEPYCAEMRALLLQAGDEAGLGMVGEGTYGATQGPRLETAAEIGRMKRDGCDLVGMTGMPEAALARELELCYATVAVVANRAAGLEHQPITMQAIEQSLKGGMEQVRALLHRLMPLL